MKRPFYPFSGTLAGLALAMVLPAAAETPTDFLRIFEQEARKADPAFQGFSVERGRQFFQQPHGNDWSCASCHTDHPAGSGKHAKTAKVIASLAPTTNPDRFTNAAKVEKWFRRNCNDVLGRTCTAQEKGDALTWLTTIRK
jgi:mono/diheme cytochrome c family protein